jgi:hypothetical protein
MLNNGVFKIQVSKLGKAQAKNCDAAYSGYVRSHFLFATPHRDEDCVFKDCVFKVVI